MNSVGVSFPVPRDIPLPLPAPPWLLQGLLVASFLAHIVFVNLLVGGAVLVFVNQVRGLTRPAYDRLARDIASTLTVNKSMAVVLGVGPLLGMGVLYTVQFYTSNILTGTAWMLVAPLIAATFLLLYLHKYSWERMAAHRRLHVALGGVVVVSLLLIPFVFLSNATLAIFPDRWLETRGLASAVLGTPSLWPRYFHFLGASLAFTSLFLVYRYGRASSKQEGFGDGLDRRQLVREHYILALFVSGLQFFVGPALAISLPARALAGSVGVLIGGGVAFAVPALVLMWREVDRPAPALGRRFPLICVFLTTTALFMASGRHASRESALTSHKIAVAARSHDERLAAREAYREMRRNETLGLSWSTLKTLDPKEKGFRTHCAVCHAVDVKLVGPPLTEIASIYAENPGGIVAWARAPGKKRLGFPQMPAFAAGVVPDQDIRAIAEYMVERGRRSTALP